MPKAQTQSILRLTGISFFSKKKEYARNHSKISSTKIIFKNKIQK
jgi:hypothetical protein